MSALLIYFWSLLAGLTPPNPSFSAMGTPPVSAEQSRCRLVRIEHPRVRRYEVAYEKNGVKSVTFQKWDYDRNAYQTVDIGRYVYLQDGRLDRIDLYEVKNGKETLSHTIWKMDYVQQKALVVQKTDAETPAMNMQVFLGAGGEIRKVDAQGENGTIELPIFSRLDGRLDSLKVPNDAALRFEYDREANPFQHNYISLFLRDRGNYSFFMNFTPNNLTGVFSGRGVEDPFVVSYGYDEKGRTTRLSVDEFHYLLTYEGDCP